MLKRYWIILYPEDKYGPRNIGVTAFSKDDAKLIIKANLENLAYNELVKSINDDTEFIENIDIRLLDKGHVIPNMGVVTFKGIWYPNFLSQ